MKRLALLFIAAFCVMAVAAQTLQGTVKDTSGEGLTGASVSVLGTQLGATVDLKGQFAITHVKKGAKVKVSFIGYQSQTLTWDGSSKLNVVLEEDSHNLNEAVVTAMGIVRKATSLTYSTQQLKSDDLMKVQDPNLVNGMEGKVSGVTITASAGGAGGASKILLRGNKSIMGNNAPLIVVDGVPMTNNTRSKINSGAAMEAESGAEGADPLSMINPDDIESLNVLKGANAAALYGSAAANGVVMITTKKGKEGRLDVAFNSNVTFDTPLLTPKMQNIYGGTNNISSGVITRTGGDSWGINMSKYAALSPAELIAHVNRNDYFKTEGTDIYGKSYNYAPQHDVYLRRQALNDIKDFYELGVTTNNSISLSGGTEKIKTYFSYANSYADGMVPTNNYTRNTFTLRQSYNFWKRLDIDVNANYVTTRTKNRVGGGTLGNPICDLYTMPRDFDLGYYRDNYAVNGHWRNSISPTDYYTGSTEQYTKASGYAFLSGPQQNWGFEETKKNNPYWLLHMNNSMQRDDRFYGSVQAKLNIWDGLAFQARASIDHDKYNSESTRSATMMRPADMDTYGHFWLSNTRTNEIYMDYLLSYNKTFKEDWSVSATAGWVAHTIKGYTTSTDANATIDLTGSTSTEGFYNPIPTRINVFDTQAGSIRNTSMSRSSNWDRAALFTAQLGWKDMVYIDGSYRRDWYRAFRQQMFKDQGAPDNYGYFGFGASAVLSEIFKMREPVSYMKYRLSYSEVGNSVPNTAFGAISVNLVKGTYTTPKYNPFYPRPEKTKSFETGFESQFFHNALNLDVTYYNSAMCNSYLEIEQGHGKQVVNSGKIRNQGIELTVGYDWQIGRGWRWKTSVNFSYNANKIVSTYKDNMGNSKDMTQPLASGIQVRYTEGGKYGDMYITDFNRWGQDVYGYEEAKYDYYGNYEGTEMKYTSDANHPGATLIAKKGDIYVNSAGVPAFNGSTITLDESNGIQTSGPNEFKHYLGNMNSNVQLSWSNTFSYKNFNLYILINGRIGGKVVSMTEGWMDYYGTSERTGELRQAAEAANLGWSNGLVRPITDGGKPAMYINDGRTLVPIKEYYQTIGFNAANYVYSATNFRLRELSFGYTWRDLLGDGKNLSLSFIGRNLFFIYKKAPVDPDVSLATGNGLGGYEMFNVPSARTFGFNVKLNF